MEDKDELAVVDEELEDIEEALLMGARTGSGST